ncbi:MAG: 2-hydroxyacyl-CoA dehydratase family protein, partial [Proteobacteria bacterium]|nr:2-hydroxyacyl-CoA dehydratase family protein [Pseudomonadota bacterium]
EESCVGERGTRNLVRPRGDSLESMMEAIVERYWRIDCAVFTPNPERTEHVEQMAADYGAQGVIHYCLQFCQPYQMEALPLEKKLESQGLPVLRVETDYSMEDVEQLKTRVEAFLEMLA